MRTKCVSSGLADPLETAFAKKDSRRDFHVEPDIYQCQCVQEHAFVRFILIMQWIDANIID